MSSSFGATWTISPQDSLSIGFPRQEYWSGVPFPSPRHPPHPGIQLVSPASAGRLTSDSATESPGKPGLCSPFWPLPSDPGRILEFYASCLNSKQEEGGGRKESRFKVLSLKPCLTYVYISLTTLITSLFMENLCLLR